MNNLTCPVLTLDELKNRDFKLPTDRWFHIAPIGEFPHPSGVRQVIDKQACDSMVNRFNEEAKDPNFPGLLIDFDHFSNDTDRPSTAAGWITKLENRSDGLWAQVRWSDVGEQSVVGGRFRLASPVWNRADCDVWTADDGTPTLRPRRLDRVALTNDPNLKGMTPLSNRAGAQEKDEAKSLEQEPFFNKAAKRDALLNYGTSEGARKGWETRRAGGMSQKAMEARRAKNMAAAGKSAPRAATKATLKKVSDDQHAANEAKLSRKTLFQLREKAKDDTMSTGAAMQSRYRQLVAKEAAKQGASGATPPPLPKVGTPEREALYAPRAATKSDLKVVLPQRPTMAQRSTLSRITSGYSSDKSAADQGGAHAEAFMQRS